MRKREKEFRILSSIGVPFGRSFRLRRLFAEEEEFIVHEKTVCERLKVVFRKENIDVPKLKY